MPASPPPSLGGLPCCALLLLSLSCAGPAPRAWRDLAEYRMLAEAETYECSAVGFGGETPLSAVAFTRLVLREDAAAAFEDLLGQGNLVARVYGLHGLWFADRDRHRQAVQELSKAEAAVPTLCGCLGGTETVGSLASAASGENWSDWSGPVELFRAGTAWLEDADPRKTPLVEWRKTLLDAKQPEGHRRWAARVLAHSLDGPGLEALLDALPVLETDLRSSAFEILQNVPPWCKGTLEVARGALDHRNRLVQQGALRASQSLLVYPWTRADCRALVPKLEKFVASFVPREGVSDREEDEAWVDEILGTLTGIGGPAGPVLARALAHPKAAVRDSVLIDFTRLGEWADETIAELARQLEHPEPDVRRGAAQALCGALRQGQGGGEPAPPPEILAAVRELVPAIRKAISSLETNDRVALETELRVSLQVSLDADTPSPRS